MTSTMDHDYNGFGSLLKTSPFFIAGIFIILVPIFIFIAFDNIRTHNKRTIEQLTDKGTALIRSFEAGTRTGVGAMHWGAQPIQWLLTETARQPEVEYILITDRQGKILAHSDPDNSREAYYQMPEPPLPDAPSTVGYRQIRSAGGEDTFEVFKKFTPNHPRDCRPETRPISVLPPADYFETPPRDWCRLLFFCDGRTKPAENFIFAGLSMKAADASRDRYLRRAVLNGAFLFLIGCTGIIALFALQAYRTANLSLARVKAFSDEVVANMPVGLITIVPDGTITFCNPAGRKIMNMIAGDSHQQNLAAFPTPLRAVAEQAMATNRNIASEVELTGPDNRSVVLDVSASPIREQNNHVSGFILLFKNLTHIKSLENEVVRSRRLAAIGKLAAGVAHEIRNPLSSIKGLATYFMEKQHDSPRDRQTAETLINEVERLNMAIAQLLEFAHPISISTIDISPRELISHSLRLIENDLMSRRIRCRSVIVTEKEVIKTDPDRVTQVLLNLYLNAIQAMGESGTLTITVADTEDTAGEIMISVADTGRGIAAEELEHIFDPYFTNRNDGTGLGLAIVHKLVESLGGEIGVKSVIDQGTIFHIKLPAGDEER